jgi:signal transduction histidine kinase
MLRGFLVLLLSLLSLLLPAAPAHALMTLNQASAVLEPAGQTPHAEQVTLPFHWDVRLRHRGTAAGKAHLSVMLPAAPDDTPQALYIARIGNTFRIMLDGELLAEMGSPGDPNQDFTKEPRLFHLPAAAPGSPRLLEITLDAQPARSAGLSPLLVGSRNEIEAVYHSEYRWHVNGHLAIAIVSSVLGVFALLMWLRQRDPLFLLYACSELLWAFQASDVVFERTPLAWPWWGIVVLSARALAALGILKFALIVVGRNAGLVRAACNVLLVLAVPALAIALTGYARWLEILVKITIEGLILWVGFIVVRHGLRSPSLEARVLAYGMLIMAAAIVRDLLVLIVLPYVLPALQLGGAWGNHYGQISWARYTWLVFGFTLAWIIAERMRRASGEIERMNQTLSERLAAREAELNAVFARQAQNERQRATVEERQRLMRDMHDGLGSQLIGAMHLAQDATIPRPVLARALQDAVDNLKLTVDAMQDTEGDLAALLGALRYRLTPRLQAAGVALAWEVASLPALGGWSIQHSRQLQMILFETFSNLLAHAGATRACLRAHHDAGEKCIRIRLGDNGCGFDVDAPRGGGQGLANMQIRAAKIGAVLRLHSDAQGTQVELAIPHAGPDEAGSVRMVDIFKLQQDADEHAHDQRSGNHAQ